MKNMKKNALMAASYVAVAALAVGGTMAYFSAQSDAVTNVNTVGDVRIEQIELERVEQTNSGKDELQEFTQGKILIPSVGERTWVEGDNGRVYQQWETGGSSALYDTSLSNVIDKFVFVKNTGDSDAYVRTIFAFEAGDLEADEWSELMHVNLNDTHWAWTDETAIPAEINGVNYFVRSAVYTGNAGADQETHKNGVLSPNETTRPSLLQYDLDWSATSEDVASFGGSYEVLVLSQAVQVDSNLGAAEMLNEAFGEVDATSAAEWFADSVTVAAPAAGAVRPAGYAPAAEGEEIDNLVVVDESDEGTNLRALYKNGLTGDMTISNSFLDGTYAMNLTVSEDVTDAVLTVDSTALRGWVSYSGFESASFTNCSFDENSNPELYKTIRPYDKTVFTNCDFAAGYEFWLDKLDGATITLVDCTIGGVEITSADQLNIVYGSAASVVVNPTE